MNRSVCHYVKLDTERNQNPCYESLMYDTCHIPRHDIYSCMHYARISCEGRWSDGLH